MTWDDLIDSVRNTLALRDLKDPSIRGRALSNLDSIMRRYFPNIITSPELLLEKDKNEFKKKLARVMSKDELNGAESSIVNNFYQILEASKFEED